MQIRHILDDSTKYATDEDTILHLERLKKIYTGLMLNSQMAEIDVSI
jgi:hypothetical protein